MEVVMRRTERGFRGKCDGYNVWLSDKIFIQPDIHIIHGEYMITGAVQSKNTLKSIHALIVVPIPEEDTLYEHSGFLTTQSGTTARTLEGEFLSPGKMKDLLYDAPMPPQLGIKASPMPPVMNGKVYAHLHDGRLRVTGLPDIRGLREAVMNGNQYQNYLRALESFKKRQQTKGK